ncbi:hypothetical protein B0T25DRAFT_546009 [Lasiosphaeria hispida]|uniref:GST N-terminal domain-containing protein n=1 Tax=Lasiosphaeria hispida TaxID=260671 RepID=A0AAJ0HCZ1_9PEZI|nr:hypothetical protein B0T25DRAFT_546009 [Lasiosphaeria hispida]
MDSAESDLTPSSDHSSERYTLHMFPFSLGSLMVKFTLVLGQKRARAADLPELTFHSKLVDLHRDDNIAEDFLKNINCCGEVPVLTGGVLPRPIWHAHDISAWLCHRFRLQHTSDSHVPTTMKLLRKLAVIQTLSLSGTSQQSLVRGDGSRSCQVVDALLKSTYISPGYRESLEWKKAFDKDTKGSTLSDNNVKAAEDETRQFFRSLMESFPRLGEGESPWIVAEDTVGSVLDGHTVPFVARLMEYHRHDLIPGRVQKYALRAMASPEWQETTHGRPTLWNATLGHVHLSYEL